MIVKEFYKITLIRERENKITEYTRYIWGRTEEDIMKSIQNDRFIVGLTDLGITSGIKLDEVISFWLKPITLEKIPLPVFTVMEETMIKIDKGRQEIEQAKQQAKEQAK